MVKGHECIIVIINCSHPSFFAAGFKGARKGSITAICPNKKLEILVFRISFPKTPHCFFFLTYLLCNESKKYCRKTAGKSIFKYCIKSLWFAAFLTFIFFCFLYSLSAILFLAPPNKLDRYRLPSPHKCQYHRRFYKH